MFMQVVKGTYAYILEAEMLFLLRFKINPFEIMQRISLLDLFSYMSILEKKIKKEQESISKSDYTKSLIALRDILMFLTMGKDGARLRK